MTEPAVPDYDEMWDEVYGDIQDRGPTHLHMRRLLRKVLAELDYRTVLDVGCGFGHNLELLTEGRALDRVAGTDLSERALEHARSAWDGEFRRLDIGRERLDSQFDLVCCSLVLEHVPGDEAALRNLRAMTVKHLLVVTIGGDFERYRTWEVQQGHVRNYQRGELERKLRAAGLAPQRTIHWGWPFYSPLARTLQNGMKATGEFSRRDRLAAKVMYLLYFLNSKRRGDLLISVSRPA